MELITGIIVCLTILFISGALVQHYAQRIGRKFMKRLQTDIFDNILNISFTDTVALQSQTVRALNALLDGNFKCESTIYIVDGSRWYSRN